jgi:hypothetical protein
VRAKWSRILESSAERLLAYHYHHGLGRLRSQLRFGIVALRHREAVSRLLAERRAIVTELDRAKTEFPP